MIYIIQAGPHRDVRTIPAADIAEMRRITANAEYEHIPCGMPLTEGDVIDANWCPHCAVTINKAAQRRGQAEWK